MSVNREMLEKISVLKRIYEAEGFIVPGVFGSVARGDDTASSDIDIL